MKIYHGCDFIGNELEIECCGEKSRNEVAHEINKILNEDETIGKMAHFENDGSLNNGFEIITNPMTMKWLYEHENIFKEELAKLEELGAKSHDTKTCGLHVHFSRKDFDNDSTSRLVYLFEKFKNELIKFSRRSSESIDRWCSFCNFYELSLDYIKNNMGNFNRYKAVNLNNTNTIEIRLFKGTLKFETYMASIELVNNVMGIARAKNNIEIQDVTFNDILKWRNTKYLLDYAKSKGLYNEEGER